VSDDELPREADVQRVRWRLNESLRSCQAMVANYRVMLGAVANDNQPADAEVGSSYAHKTTEAEEA